MIQLMKNNSSYVIQASLLMPLLAIVWLINIRPLSAFQIFMGGMWIFLVVLGGAINGEMIENKMKGYAFLCTLPVRDRDIVMAKFFMAGLTALVLVVYIEILFGFLPGPAHLFSLGRIMIPFFAGVALLLTALLYVLVYRIGFSRSIKIAWAVFFSVILFPLLIMEFVLNRKSLDFSRIFDAVISLPWVIWVLAGLAFLFAYIGLMALAVKVKKARRG